VMVRENNCWLRAGRSRSGKSSMQSMRSSQGGAHGRAMIAGVCLVEAEKINAEIENAP